MTALNEISAQKPVKPDLQEFEQALLTALGGVWQEFESWLDATPLLRRLNEGVLTRDDYRAFLRNWRPQVVEGARWIALAASNISEQNLELRSMMLKHAVAEQRDFQLLEDDYVAAGGRLEDIQSAPKNIGAEALSAWMFYRAGRPDPFDLLGAMFIIEGLGAFKAGAWGRAIRTQLDLPADRPRFLLYHDAADANHMIEFQSVVRRVASDDAVRRTIVKTARVTARLYALQMDSLDRY